MGNTIQKLYDQGQSIWCDSLSRALIETGALQKWIDAGVTGVTSNPTIFMKAITGGSDYDRRIDELTARDLDTMSRYEELAIPDITDAADLLRPVFDRTKGVDGYISLEVNPKLAYDTNATVEEARRLFARLDRPNVFIKVPATDEGIPAIQTLIGEGINVNVTLIFSRDMHEKTMQAYIAGLNHLAKAGGDVSKVASVASFFVSRVDSVVDKELEQRKTDGADVDDLMGRAAIANAKLAYRRFGEVFGDSGAFASLAAKGARVQRPLWASTSVKNPAYSPTMYTDALIGPNTVNTLPPSALEQVLKQGASECTLGEGLSEASKALDRIKKLGIDIDAITAKLRVDGVNMFAASFDELLADLEQKQAALKAAS